MKNKQQCEKCKNYAEDLWLWSSKRKDGTEKELWICENCAKMNIKGFDILLQRIKERDENEIENAE